MPLNFRKHTGECYLNLFRIHRIDFGTLRLETRMATPTEEITKTAPAITMRMREHHPLTTQRARMLRVSVKFLTFGARVSVFDT